MTSINEFVKNNGNPLDIVMVFHDDVHLVDMPYRKPSHRMTGMHMNYPDNGGFGLCYTGTYYNGVLMSIRRGTYCRRFHIGKHTDSISKIICEYFHGIIDFPVYLRTTSDDINRDHWKLQEEPKLLTFWKTDLYLKYNND